MHLKNNFVGFCRSRRTRIENKLRDCGLIWKIASLWAIPPQFKASHCVIELNLIRFRASEGISLSHRLKFGSAKVTPKRKWTRIKFIDIDGVRLFIIAIKGNVWLESIYGPKDWDLLLPFANWLPVVPLHACCSLVFPSKNMNHVFFSPILNKTQRNLHLFTRFGNIVFRAYFFQGWSKIHGFIPKIDWEMFSYSPKTWGRKRIFKSNL